MQDFEGVRVDREVGMYEAAIGDTHLGYFTNHRDAWLAYQEANDYAEAMCGSYQRSCEDGSLAAWECEVGDGFDHPHIRG